MTGVGRCRDGSDAPGHVMYRPDTQMNYDD